MGSPRPGFPPIPRRRPRTQATGLRARGSQSGPPPSPALGRRVHPAGCRDPQSVSPRSSVRLGAPSGAARAAADSEREVGGTVGSRHRRVGGRGAGSLPSNSARRRRRSARLGLLHYCFRPRRGRPAHPARPLPHVPPSEAPGVMARRGAGARSPRGGGPRASPPARCRALYADAVGDPASPRPGFARFPGARRLARPRLPRGGGGVHRRLPLRSGNSGPGRGAAGCGGRTVPGGCEPGTRRRGERFV